MRKLGTSSNPNNRFFKLEKSKDSEFVDEIYESDEFTKNNSKTTINNINVKTVLRRNKSPDVPFHLSLNPYQGCEHGCVYCFARPSHAYLDLSVGIDFETKIFAKINAPELFEKEIAKKNYQLEVLALGMNTDCYQPAEREYCLTRRLLELCLKYSHPVSLVTKSSLILRDLDILQLLAEKNLIHVAISVTTLDNVLKSKLEPQATSPAKRIQTIKLLAEHNIPVNVLVAPIIPKLNDSEIEAILTAAKKAGASNARYVFLRLPYELKELFSDWLEQHYPLKKAAVLSLISQSRKGKLYQNEFHRRMTGEGIFAEMIEKRFHLATKKLGYKEDWQTLNFKDFIKPTEQINVSGLNKKQLSLF